MRASDVLGRTVVDDGGANLGRVRDIRLTKDALEVEALIVGRRLVTPALDYTYGHVTHPRALAWIVKRIGGELRFIQWEDVMRMDPSVIVVRTGASRALP